jgi:polar amino acid transport system substrate-binding protein
MKIDNLFMDNEQRLSIIADNTLDWEFWLGPDGRFVWISPACEEVCGYTAREIMDDPSLMFDRIAHPEDAPRWREHKRSVDRHDPHPADMDLRVTHKSGRLVWVRHVCKPIHDAMGYYLGRRGCNRDITARKLAEEKLRRSEEMFRGVVESSPTAMHFYQLEADGRLTLARANPAACQILDTDHEPLLGKPFEEAFPDLAARGLAATIRLVASGESGPQSFKLVRREGRLARHFDVLIFRTAPGVATVDFLDITERVHLEEVMIQTEKMLSVGGLAAGMAHEINNPLSGIMQNAQVVMRRLSTANLANIEAAMEVGCDIEAIRRYLEKRDVLAMLEGIRESATRAAHIVSSMLAFSRKSESVHAPANVNSILEKAVALCCTDFDLKKNYDFRSTLIERDFAPGLPEVPCSVTQVQQVFLNILANAAHAMAEDPGEGPPRIVLRTRRETEHVRAEIEDNGPGMDENVRRKIFEPFFTTKPHGEGTGLGLSVSYFIIVNNHKGSIEVDSWPGRGTRFTIRLPLRDLRETPKPAG